ncbi:Regulator of G-protein signaling 8 [Fukomys damarensis]|uniref:Regulator of G-protein signaling 8 n=1 Tax=Fukomys damarensis TaxID=885580 RepID=A0A091CTS2_FUKDA|nr:Regulator of G-protein signaling 8 [Fukomys damarensis]
MYESMDNWLMKITWPSHPHNPKHQTAKHQVYEQDRSGPARGTGKKKQKMSVLVPSRNWDKVILWTEGTLCGPESQEKNLGRSRSKGASSLRVRSCPADLCQQPAAPWKQDGSAANCGEEQRAALARAGFPESFRMGRAEESCTAQAARAWRVTTVFQGKPRVLASRNVLCLVFSHLSDHPVGNELQAMRTGQRQNKGMRTRLGCLSHKSDSCSDFTAILPDKPNRALKRLSTEEATRWADSFDVLLSHKYGVAAFRAFLKTEFSEENLEFWLACEEFKKTRSTAKLVSKAHRIFEEFVDVQAPREVNIDFQTREATRKNMQEPSLTCFDQAQGKVHSLMEKDSYPRFLRSKMYLDLLSQSQRRLS